MVYEKVSSRYTRTKVQTANKLELVVLCYEKAIQFLNRAKIGLQTDQIEEKYGALNKALRIINELASSLDSDKGGQIAENLFSIYSYLTHRLAEGDLKKDISAFDEAIRIMSDLKEAWEQILDQEQDQSSGVADRPDQEHHFSQIAV